MQTRASTVSKRSPSSEPATNHESISDSESQLKKPRTQESDEKKIAKKRRSNELTNNQERIPDSGPQGTRIRTEELDKGLKERTYVDLKIKPYKKRVRKTPEWKLFGTYHMAPNEFIFQRA